MRTLFLKQAHDIFGPWEDISYAQTTPRALLGAFIYKITFWEMTCLLQADWRIVPTILKNYFFNLVDKQDYVRDAVQRFQTHGTPLESLSLAGYDTVITFEPFLSPAFMQRHPATRFYYLRHEHSSPEFKDDMHHPAGTGYHGMIDHMCGVFPHNPALERFYLSLPYMRDPASMRACFPRTDGPDTEKPRILIEPRTLIKAVKKDSHNLWIPACDAYLAELNARYPATLSVRPNLHARSYNTPDDGAGDAFAYYETLAAHDYFISTVAAGAGQALADAASLGLACLGTEKLVYHRMLCHPDLLQDDFEEAIRKAITLHQNAGQKARIRTHQDEQLAEHMQRRPLQLLATPKTSDRIPPRPPEHPVTQQPESRIVEYGFARKKE